MHHVIAYLLDVRLCHLHSEYVLNLLAVKVMRYPLYLVGSAGLEIILRQNKDVCN